MKTITIPIFTVCFLIVIGAGDTVRAISKPVDAGKNTVDKPMGERFRRDKQGRGKRDGGRSAERFKAFRDADANKDSALSFEEFSTLKRLQNMDEKKRRKLFDFLDRDKDGSLQIRELQPAGEPKWMEPLRRTFKKLDVDGDNALSLNELSQLQQFSDKDKKLLTAMFNRLDRNQNGKIEMFEIKPQGEHRKRPDIDFERADTDSSGGLDFAEYSNIPWMNKMPKDRLKRLFEHIDADNDGEISLQEIRTARKMHRPRPYGQKPDGLQGKPFRRGADRGKAAGEPRQGRKPRTE